MLPFRPGGSSPAPDDKGIEAGPFRPTYPFAVSIPSERTGLLDVIVALLILPVILTFWDLLRPGPMLRSIWNALFGPRSFIWGVSPERGRSWLRWRR